MNIFINKINKFLNQKWIFKEIKDNTEFYKFYTNAKNTNLNQINYEQIINIVKESKILDTYINIINSYNIDLINQSNIHGLEHIIRTSLFLLIISIKENTDRKYFISLYRSNKRYRWRLPRI